MISIVIPNYNRFDLLRKCINSILCQKNSEYEIIVVDNGSEEKEQVSYDPKVKYIWLESNMGFSKAVNEGISQAKGELIALLNNDTEVELDWIDKIYEVFNENEDILFATCKIKNFFRKDLLDDAGDIILSSGKVYKVGHREEDIGQYDKQKYAFGASGAASIYRREFFERVGYFDEDFFAYLEDADISFRANLYGYRCLFISDAVVYHIGSATTGSVYNDFTVYYLGRNTILLILKNFPLKVIISSALAIVVHFFSLQVFFTFKGYGISFFKGVLDALRMSKNMLSKRQEVMRKRAISDFEIMGLLKQNRCEYNRTKRNRVKQ